MLKLLKAATKLLKSSFNELFNIFFAYFKQSIDLNIPTNIKEILDIIISDLSAVYKLEFIDPKKIKISQNDKNIGEIKILKTTINLILDSGLELKNINKENWNKILNLINT